VNIPQESEPPAYRDHFICPLCQAENRADAKFCRLCGKPRLNLDCAVKLQNTEADSVAAPQELEQIQAGSKSTLCRQCQAQVRSTDRFCSWCGQEGPCDGFADCLYCPKCQKRLPAQANFCFACGVHVGPHKRLKLRPPGEIFQAEDAEFFPTFDA
jgi:predicted amidophosphoribosyltransferase